MVDMVQCRIFRQWTIKQTSSLCHLRRFVICEPCLAVYFLVYSNTTLSNSLHLLVYGGLVFWALPIQFILSTQAFLLSLVGIPTHSCTPKYGYMVFTVSSAKSEATLGYFSGLAGRWAARDGSSALPLRIFLENAKMAPQRWWRTPGVGYAETVPAGGETALCAAPMPSAHSNGPGGGVAGNRQSFILSGRHENGIYGLMACSWGM